MPSAMRGKFHDRGSKRRTCELAALPTSWSVAECLDHLAATNRVYLNRHAHPALRAREQGRLRRRPAKPGWIGGFFVRSLSRLRRMRIKAPQSIQPRSALRHWTMPSLISVPSKMRFAPSCTPMATSTWPACNTPTPSFPEYVHPGDRSACHYRARKTPSVAGAAGPRGC
jgi:hypothetical protein